jgi:acylphosphatase
MANVRAHVVVSGRVQGVFFRASTRDKANELDLNGWVRNLRDGRVEAVFEGPKDRVELMLKWCEKGPPHADVTNVETSWEKPENDLAGFEIHR